MKMGVIIKNERKLLNLSQSALAKILNTTQDTVSLWELNKRTPDAEMIVKLCKLFQVSADYLLGLENEDGTKNR